MSGLQISDMTDSLTVFPDGAFVPLVVTSNTGGLVTTENYRYNAGLYLAKLSTLASATGATLIGTTGPSTVQADITARPTSATLAAFGGALLIGYAGYSGATATTVQSRLRASGFQELASSGNSFTAAYNAVTTSGTVKGEVKLESGAWTATTGVTAVSRTNIVGAGRQASVITFTPASNLSLITLNNNTDQSTVRDLGMAEGNSTAKTGINIINCADVVIERVATQFNNAGSIGLRTRGRQLISVRDCDFKAERPIVISPNATSPTLTADFCTFEKLELTCLGDATTTTMACIEVEDGAELSNTAFRDVAMVFGEYGFLWDDATSPGASGQLLFENCRAEQGKATGWSWYIRNTTPVSVQSLKFSNCVTNTLQNGMYLEVGASQTIIDGCTFAQVSPLVSLQVVMAAGGVLVLRGCDFSGGVAPVITNGKCIYRAVLGPSDSQRGGLEIWTYSSDDTDQRNGEFLIDGMMTAKDRVVANDGVITLATNGFNGVVEVYVSSTAYAEYQLRGGTNAVAELSDPQGVFTVTKDNASTTNIYYESSAYKLQNKSGGSLTYNVLYRGRAI